PSSILYSVTSPQDVPPSFRLSITSPSKYHHQAERSTTQQKEKNANQPHLCQNLRFCPSQSRNHINLGELILRANRVVPTREGGMGGFGGGKGMGWKRMGARGGSGIKREGEEREM